MPVCDQSCNSRSLFWPPTFINFELVQIFMRVFATHSIMSNQVHELSCNSCSRLSWTCKLSLLKSFTCLDLTLSYDDQSCNSRLLFLTFINFELVQIFMRVHESFRYSLNNVQSSLINFHVTHECFLLTRPDWSERSNCWMEHKTFWLPTYLTGKSSPIKSENKIRMRSIFARYLRNIDQICPLIQRQKFGSDRSGH
jgi:hypothetical protein